jgi:aminopeptidase YwaD
VIARKGADPSHRVVVVAHIDTRMGTPGANDNASGVIALLLLAELLADYTGQLGIELVAMNGEDYYSNPGEQQYLAVNAGRFDEIVLGINLDDVGYRKGRVAYSLYGCPPDLAASIRQVFSVYDDLVEGDAWYQGDHGLFLMKGRPALAMTSELVAELMAEITHTPRDTPEVVNISRLVQVAHALRDLLSHLDQFGL